MVCDPPSACQRPPLCLKRSKRECMNEGKLWRKDKWKPGADFEEVTEAEFIKQTEKNGYFRRGTALERAKAGYTLATNDFLFKFE